MNKFRVDYIRDGLVEEFHEGLYMLSSELYETSPYYLRSCAKPLQATLLIDYGIDLTSEELALCCGSHAGEECHIRIARQILEKFDIDESLLKCGVHAPLARSMQDKMLLRGEKPTAIHNNCSGKHIGFLVICKVKGWDMTTYDKPNHPLQIAIRDKIYDLSSLPRPTGEGWGEGAPYPITTDGCGVPILSMPLKNMLIGYKNLLNYTPIIQAIRNNPYFFGGENRLDTEIIEKTDNLIAKVGAGGLCIVFNIKTKEGFVVKINDCSMEARRIAVLELINSLNWANLEFDKTIKTLHGQVVGNIQVNL